MVLINGSDIITNIRRCSISPLHWAAWHGNSAGVDCLLEAGANVFSRDITGELFYFIVAKKVKKPAVFNSFFIIFYLCLRQNN